MLQQQISQLQPSHRWVIANEELKFCWETDEEFGNRRVRHELGSGSYGRVYKATYKHQHVAVKEIDIVPSQKEKQIASYEKEIESAIDFWEVPNIVRCLGGSIKKNQKKEVLRIVFEFLDARLDEELYNRDFTEKERRKVVSDVARGLTFLHKSLITHRDLKPENVMLHKGMGCWKLIDFGTATSKSSKLEVTKKTGAGRGTVGYMAPELYTETGGNHKVDVFAFATTSWSVYAEDRPFPDSSDEGEIRDKITKGERPAVSDVKHTIPEGLEGLLQTCWDHDPEKRPDMAYILKKVEDLEKQIENMSTTPSPPQPSPQPMHTDQPGMDDHEVEVPVSRGYSWEIVHPDEYIGESQVDPIANGVGGAAAVAAGSGIDATAIDFEASHNRTPISNAEWQIFAKILFLKKAFGLSETSAISKQVLLSGWFRKLKDSNWKADRERWFELTSTQIKYYADRIGDEDAPLLFGSRADPEKQKGTPIYLKGNTVVTKSTYTYTTLADPVENGVGSEGLFFLNTVQKEGRCLQIEQPNRSKKHSWRLVPIKETEGSHETATQLDAWYDTISTLKRMEKLIELTWGCEEVRLGLQSEASTKSESKISFARLLKTFSILDESDLNEGGLVTPKWTYNRFQVFTFVRERELRPPSPRPQSPRPPRPQRALSRRLDRTPDDIDAAEEQGYTTTTTIEPRTAMSAKGPGGVVVDFPAGFIDVEEEVAVEITILDAVETGSKEFVNLPEGFVPVSPLVSLQVKSLTSGTVLADAFAKEVRVTLPHCIRNANPNGFQVYCMRDGEANFNKLEDPLPFRSDDFSRSAVFATNHFTQFQIICAVGVAALAAAAAVSLAPQLSVHKELELAVHKELELAVMVLMKEGVIKSIAVVLRALDNGVLTIEDKIAQMIVDDGGWQTYRPRNQLEFTPGTKQIELSLETDSLEVCRSATPPFPTSRTRHVEFDVSAFDFDLVLHVRPAGGSDVDAYCFTLQDRGGGGVSGSGGGGGDSGGGSGVSGGGGGGDGCYSSGGGDSGGAAASSIQTEPQLQPQSSPSSLPIAANIEERRQIINRARDLVAARAICNIDIVNYTAIWEQTLRAEGRDVADLETELGVVEARLQRSSDPQQPTTLNGISDTTSGEYLLQLNLAFDKVEATLFADVEDLVESLDIANLDFHRGPPKKDDRCFEKAQLAYNDDCSKIRDLRRASVVCPNIAAVRTVCAKLDADPKIQLLRVKNRFSRAYNAKDKSAGYRDVQFNIKAVDPDTGIELVWELQVHLAAVEDLKMRLQGTADATGRTGHGRYVAFRTIVERL